MRSVEGIGSWLMTAARAAVVGGAASRALGEGMNALPEARAIAKMIIRMADVDVDVGSVGSVVAALAAWWQRWQRGGCYGDLGTRQKSARSVFSKYGIDR